MKLSVLTKWSASSSRLEHAGQFHHMPVGLQAGGQHHHVEHLEVDLALLVHIADFQVALVIRRNNGVHPGPVKAHPLLPGPVVVIFKTLAVGAHVHVEDGGLKSGVGMFHTDHRLLQGEHAAYRGAVGIAGPVDVPGAHALQPGDFLRFLAVGGPFQVAHAGAGRAEQPLELHGGDHVGQPAVTGEVKRGRVETGKTGGQHHGADLQDMFLLPVVKTDGPGRAYPWRRCRSGPVC